MFDWLIKNQWWSIDNQDFEGGERHLSIQGNTFQLDDMHNCIELQQAGSVYGAGYAIDDVYLIELPFEIDTTLFIKTFPLFWF